MKGKMKLIVPLVVLLIGVGGGYKFALAKPAKPEPKPKVEGTVYILGKEFLVNLSDGRYAKFTAALVLDPKDESAAATGGEGGTKPPDGFGTMPQEAVVRSVINDDVSDVSARDVDSAEGRDSLRKQILVDLKKHTDVKADDIVFTDFVVQ
jgi:flagellar basal body-associated protein FliL